MSNPVDSSPDVAAGDAPNNPPRRPIYRTLKRALDVTASGVGLVLLSPIFLAAAIAVRFDSRGAVFSVRQRVGRNFVPFGIIKFRTMVSDADRQGSQITASSDARITRAGRILRKTKIDELPQLINILRGEMSLVGPRPEVPKYVEMFREDYAYILSVRPGVTDPASIKYRDESAHFVGDDHEREYAERILPDKIALARHYVANATILGDLGLILKTLLRIAR